MNPKVTNNARFVDPNNSISKDQLNESGSEAANLGGDSPTAFATALETGDAHVVKEFLQRDFHQACKTPGYDWLSELQEVGYSVTDMAELILDERSGLPWVYFEPFPRGGEQFKLTQSHIPNCAHTVGTGAKALPRQPHTLRRSTSLYLQTRRRLEELCGLGGVAPCSRDTSLWNGVVSFHELNKTSNKCSMVSYSIPGTAQRHCKDRIADVLENFIAAAAISQIAGLCCDSFTVLVHETANLLQLESLKFTLRETC